MSENRPTLDRLSGIDEEMVHQTADPIRVMAWPDDPRTYERYWTVAYDRTGDLLVVHGLACYPGLDTVEAFGIVVYRGQHTTVRAHRRLGNDRMEKRVGPLAMEIVKPFEDVRLSLDENRFGIRYDLHFADTKRAVAVTDATYPGMRPRTTGGYETFGAVTGWVEVQGTRVDLLPGAATGTRDHHWGLRNGVGGPDHYEAPEMPPGVPSLPGYIGAPDYQEFEYPDWSFWISRVLYNHDDPRPGAGPRLEGKERRLRFDPVSKAFVEGVILFRLEDGTRKEVHFERLGHQVACLRCGMYPQGGGTPDRGIWQGMFAGDGVVEGETFDVTDPQVVGRVDGLHDNQCLVTCEGQTTIGLFESIDPTLYYFCKAGVPGYAFLE